MPLAELAMESDSWQGASESELEAEYWMKMSLPSQLFAR